MENSNITETQENIPVMYVLIRDDMRYENEAVQAGHAVAEYLLNYTPIYKGVMWKNDIMVYLAVKDEKMLQEYATRLENDNRNVGMFTEPDWGVAQNTALATIAFKGELFSELRTIKMPKGYLLWLRKYIYRIKRSLPKILPI